MRKFAYMKIEEIENGFILTILYSNKVETSVIKYFKNILNLGEYIKSLSYIVEGEDDGPNG